MRIKGYYPLFLISVSARSRSDGYRHHDAHFVCHNSVASNFTGVPFGCSIAESRPSYWEISIPKLAQNGWSSVGPRRPTPLRRAESSWQVNCRGAAEDSILPLSLFSPEAPTAYTGISSESSRWPSIKLGSRQQSRAPSRATLRGTGSRGRWARCPPGLGHQSVSARARSFLQ